jgi:hypothetical protein
MLVSNTNLLNIIKGTGITPSASPIDDDSTVHTLLSELEYCTPHDYDDTTNHLNIRSRVRYLAALFPTLNVIELSEQIHAIINNRNLPLEEIRLIIKGRRLNNPQKVTNEVPINIIQGIGKCLTEGLSVRATSREMKVSYDTVEAIERYLGIKAKREAVMIDDAVEAARLNESVRVFAHKHKISRSKAHRLLKQGKSVLQELGENNE